MVMCEEYESAMHVIADALVKQFEGSDAVNYIEQTFTDKTDESKRFVLTMQSVEGLTPCQKLQSAIDAIECIKDIASKAPVDRLILSVAETALNSNA